MRGAAGAAAGGAKTGVKRIGARTDRLHRAGGEAGAGSERKAGRERLGPGRQAMG